MMKRMELFCPSVASTQICLSTADHQSPSCIVLGGGGGGGRAIDRHNPLVRDNRRRGSNTNNTSHFITASNTTAAPSSSSSSPSQPRKKSSKSKNKSRISSCAKRCDRTISPPGSARYLLSDTAFADEFSPLPTTPSSESFILEPNPGHALPPNSSSSLLCPTPISTPTPTTTTTNDHQVVVLRVSLHCRGCEGKVRKHLSKMKGVTSFNIDFAMKKVTVIGDVTPVGVLASISRVKNAQFWPSLSSSSPVFSTQRSTKSMI